MTIEETTFFDSNVAPGRPAFALRQAGWLRLQNNAVSEAVELLRQARDVDPTDGQTHLCLGLALQRLGRHAEALEAFERARATAPEHAFSFLHMATSWIALGKADFALQSANEACGRAPYLASGRLAQGNSLMALDEPARAERAFTVALELKPEWAEAWVMRASARVAAGKADAAKTDLREALRLAPDHVRAKASLVALEAPLPAAGARRLSAWRPTSPSSAVGLAVEYLSQKAAFAALPFGEWSQVLFHQVVRGHYLFVVDQDRHIKGFLGWALTEERLAELWVGGQSGLTNDQCLEGDCTIVNAWAADAGDAQLFLRDAVFKLFAGRRLIYFKRHYPDGRERAVRLPVPPNRKSGFIATK